MSIETLNGIGVLCQHVDAKNRAKWLYFESLYTCLKVKDDL